jgi:hypothetical protein
MFFKLNILLIIITNVSTLVVDISTNIRKIPEYAEYLRQKAEILNSSTPIPAQQASTSSVATGSTTIPIESSQQVGLNPAGMIQTGPFVDFPSISLCKDSPGENNFYGHVFCWSMMALYALLVISLIIYQLRSILWIKENMPPKKRTKNGQPTNQQSDGAREDEGFPGMLPLRPLAASFGLELPSGIDRQLGPARV